MAGELAVEIVGIHLISVWCICKRFVACKMCAAVEGNMYREQQTFVAWLQSRLRLRVTPPVKNGLGRGSARWLGF